ncbi:MAG: efflux RND transporter periplasmic adaptor subunit [Deltaproteobacteria bacterium]|nr:efflux RND transporter periplasmic adaptor subunit [Deltaproteobacteria bacterium]
MKKGIGTALIIILLFGVGCKKSAEKKKVERPTIQVSKLYEVHKQVVHPPYEATGTVKSEKTVMVSPKVMGYIQAIYVKEGDRVKKGQKLVSISSPEINAKVNMAEAGLKAAMQAKVEVQAHLREAMDALEAAKAQYHLAEVTYNRFKNLVKTESISQQEFDQVEAKYKAAKAGLSRAQEMIKVIEAKEAQVDAQIKAAQSQVAEAKSYLNYTLVRSPIDGRVVNKMIDTGNLIAPGRPILSLADEKDYRLYVSIEESLHNLIKEGDPVTVIFSSKTPIETKIVRVVPDVDPRTRTFMVKVMIPSDIQGIRPGMFGRAIFRLPEKKTYLVPSKAVVTRGQLEFTYVITPDNLCQMRLIKLGKRYGDKIEVLSGLEEGEKIIAEDVTKAIDGARVKRG